MVEDDNIPQKFEQAFNNIFVGKLKFLPTNSIIELTTLNSLILTQHKFRQLYLVVVKS